MFSTHFWYHLLGQTPQPVCISVLSLVKYGSHSPTAWWVKYHIILNNYKCFVIIHCEIIENCKVKHNPWVKHVSNIQTMLLLRHLKFLMTILIYLQWIVSWCYKDFLPEEGTCWFSCILIQGSIHGNEGFILPEEIQLLRQQCLFAVVFLCCCLMLGGKIFQDF